jgi:hypothetical protein
MKLFDMELTAIDDPLQAIVDARIGYLSSLLVRSSRMNVINDGFEVTLNVLTGGRGAVPVCSVNRDSR